MTATIITGAGPGAGTTVDAPRMEPPRVSLLTSANVVTNVTEAEWLAGLRFLPEVNRLPDNPYWWDCPGVGGDTPIETYGANGKLPANPRNRREYRPYMAWVGVRCSLTDWQAMDHNAYLNRYMEAYQSEIIEEELWTGARVAVPAAFPNGYFTDANVVQLNGGTALGYARALAELEQGIADRQAGPGMIHAQHRVVSLWTQNGLVTPTGSGRQLKTALGTLVVPGRGYPGTGDGLSPATTAASYAYGTGMVQVWLGPIRYFDADDDSDNSANGLRDADIYFEQNDLRLRAERAVAAWWDGVVQVGIEVTLTQAH